MKQYALIFIAALGLAGNAQAILLDEFSDPSFVFAPGSPPTLTPGQEVVDYQADGNPISNLLTDLSDVLGGSRELSVDKLGPLPVNFDAASLVVDKTGGQDLAWLNESNVTSEGTVIWEGVVGVNPTGLGDFTDSKAYLFDVISVANTVTVSMLLETVGGGTLSNQRTFTIADNGQTIFLPLGSAAGSVDLTDVRKITMTLTGVTDADITLDKVRVVPEPTPLALLAGGLGLIGFRLRSTRRRA